MPEEYVTRGEYEQFIRMYEVRHAELRVEVKEIETNITGQMNHVTAKLDTLSSQLQRNSTNGWKLLAVSLLNFMLGGGLVALLNTLHFFH